MNFKYTDNFFIQVDGLLIHVYVNFKNTVIKHAGVHIF